MGIRERVSEGVKSVQRRVAPLPRNLALITGCPRSGTTALVRWLDGQRRVYAFSETRAMYVVSAMAEEARAHNRLAKRPESTVGMAREVLRQYYYASAFVPLPALIIDKEPLHPAALREKTPADFIGNLRYALPDLKVVVMVRDPVSTIWSMTQRKWGHSIVGWEPAFLPLHEHVSIWKEASSYLLEAHEDDGLYVCQFERLCTEPAAESERVFDFLGIKGGKPFAPRATKTTGFAPEDLRLIRSETEEVVGALGDRGVVDVSLWAPA